MQRTDFRRPSFLTVDTDGHLNELGVDWVERLPKKFAELAPQFGSSKEIADVQTKPFLIGGKSIDYVKKEMTRTGPPPAKERPANFWVSREGEQDPHKRLPDMDYEGYDVGVVFGATIPITGLTTLEDSEFAGELARAYNDWVAKEYCAVNPERLKGIAIVPLQFPEIAAKEVRRAKELGLVGVQFWPHVNGKPLHDESLDIVWRACAEVDMPACVHTSGYKIPLGDRVDRYFFTRILARAPVMTQVCMSVCGYGLFEKYPSLRVGLFEGLVGWAPNLIDMFNDSWDLIPSQLPWQKVSPAEHMTSGRMMFACNPTEKSLPMSIKYVGEDNIAINSDYSHWDGYSPESIKMVYTRDDITEEQKRKILGANAQRFFKIEAPKGAPFGL